ncbi:MULTISPECIES: hypothetical protein [unclassified Fibrobacter]|uniref:hypothetical protein n=1 Tax=unclassified Fibrobacter TaxID=2634177 RepID=UPI0025C3C7BC|nr:MULTISPECIES: hypothetical protein [unclassified Fibrobacter]
MIKPTSTIDRITADSKQKRAVLKLQEALADGERSAEQGGWLSAANVRKKIYSAF